MRNMTQEQLESVYYAWCRAQSVREAYLSLIDKSPIDTYHDLVSLPYSKFFFIWVALAYTVVEFLDKFGQVPLNVASEVRILDKPWHRFRNAVFHIKNHPFAQEYDALSGLPDWISRIHRIHDATGEYLCRQLGFSYPPFVETPVEFASHDLSPAKPKR